MSTYKETKSLDERRAESAGLINPFNRIPVVFEPKKGPGHLEKIRQRVQAVHGNDPIIAWANVIRSTLDLHKFTIIDFTVPNVEADEINWDCTFGELYEKYRDENGFLYLNYAMLNKIF